MTRLDWIGLTGGAVACVIAAPASAQVRTFDIPAQAAESAVAEFAEQANVQIFAARKDTRGRRTNAVKGQVRVADALAQLLQGTGLEARKAGERAFTIVPLASAAAAGERGEAETAPGAESEPDIVVTGTRIRGTTSSPSPTYTVRREDFARVGATSVEEMTRVIPQNFVGGANEYAGAVSSTRQGLIANTTAATGFNLRGLGPGATLTLLDGHRLAPGGLGDFVDISNLPLAALEAIQIVPDGASAIYGSDAVGGVVNLILRKDFRGAETSIRYGSVTDGDLTTFSASQVFGIGNDRDSLMAVVDYSNKNPLLARDREYVNPTYGADSYLSPDAERGGALVDLRKGLTDTLTLTGLGLYSERKSGTKNYQSYASRYLTVNQKTRDLSGIVGLEWDGPAGWTARADYSYSQSRARGRNFAPDTGTGAFDLSTKNRKTWTTAGLDLEGPLVRLPGGDVRLAVGAEHRSEKFELLAPSAYSQKRNIDAVYGEVLLPMIGADNAGGFGERLELSGALRYEDYSDAGSSTNVKLGAVFAPIDGVTLRGTYGTSFRAAPLYYFDRSNSIALTYDLPTPGGLVPILYLINFPEEGLGPERAKSWSAGFDIAPELLGGIQVKATYYDIKYRDRIIQIYFDENFNNPITQALLISPVPQDIRDLIDTVALAFLDSATPIEDIDIAYDGRVKNLSRTITRGIDLVADTSFEAGGGTATLSVNANYLLDHIYKVSATTAAESVEGDLFNPSKLRVTAGAGWRNDSFSADMTVNRVGRLTDRQDPANPRKVDAMTTLDLSLAYRFHDDFLDGTTIRVTANNLFDTDPPQITDLFAGFGNQGFDPQNHSPVGRYLSLELTRRW